MRGLVHIYTGDGKGKTTAAIGLGVRAAGSGMRVLMVQFMKGRSSSEENSLEKLKPGFELYKIKAIDKFSWQMNTQEKEQMKDISLQLLNYAVDRAAEKDLIILDEVMSAISTGMIDLQRVVDFVKNKPLGLEVILTGRNAPEELVELSDYVSEIREIKHPMHAGVAAREGIEF